VAQPGHDPIQKTPKHDNGEEFAGPTSASVGEGSWAAEPIMMAVLEEKSPHERDIEDASGDQPTAQELADRAAAQLIAEEEAAAAGGGVQGTNSKSARRRRKKREMMKQQAHDGTSCDARTARSSTPSESATSSSCNVQDTPTPPGPGVSLTGYFAMAATAVRGWWSGQGGGVHNESGHSIVEAIVRIQALARGWRARQRCRELMRSNGLPESKSATSAADATKIIQPSPRMPGADAPDARAQASALEALLGAAGQDALTDTADSEGRLPSSLPSTPQGQLAEEEASRDAGYEKATREAAGQTVADKAHPQPKLPTQQMRFILNYKLGPCLGKGTHGTVFKSLNMESGDVVAIKQVPLRKIPSHELPGTRLPIRELLPLAI